MNNIVKKSISVFMAMLMLFTIVPMAAFATDPETCEHDYSELISPVEATCTTPGNTGGMKCSKCGDIKDATETPALSHDFQAGNTVAPTCTEDGYTVYKCSRCDATENRNNTTKLGHDLVKQNTVNPTCTSDGYTVYKCSRCDATENKDNTTKLGHDWNKRNTVTPTCTDEGYTIYKCSRCNISENRDTVAATGHKDTNKDGRCDVCDEPMSGGTTPETPTEPTTPTNPTEPTTPTNPAECQHEYVLIDKIDATCTEAGNKGGYKCALCGNVKDGEVIPALGHDWKKGTPVKPTCTTDGYTEATCSRCNTKEKQDIVTAPGHKYKEEGKKATCTEDGVIKYTCEVCGDNYEEKSSATGHKFSSWLVEQHATCSQPEIKARTCIVCGEKETQTGEATAHNWTKKTVEPSCENMGYTEYTCKNCGETKQENVKEELGHDVLVEPMEPATCNNEGRTERRSCKRCGKVFLEPSVIPKTDHKIMIYQMVPPSCTAEGSTEGQQCEFCGEIFKEIEIIPAIGHNYAEEVIKEASCITDGVSKFTCKTCEDNYTATVPAKGHDYDTEWTIDVVETCTEPGEKSHYCKVCGNRIDVTEINALGGQHQFKPEWTIDKIATCQEAGLKSHHCKVCDTKTDITTIPMAHRYVTTTTKATLKKDGLVEKICSICGDVESSKVIAKIGTVTLSKTVYTCDSTAKTPSVTVKDANGKKLVKGTDYTVTYESGRKKVGTYTVTINFKGNYTGEKTLKFKINLGKTTGVEIKRNEGKKTATLKWTKTNGAQKYVVYYATAKDGKYKKLSTTTKTTLKTREFGKGKVIYFKVRPYTVTESGKGQYGEYSKVVKVKIK